MKSFSLKFLDIMVGIVLGLGFQWWPSLREVWQYIAFIFVYLDIVDYWIDYSPSLKKFPPKREVDVLLDVAIMFALFLYIYSTQQSIAYFLSAFIVLKILDFFWLFSSKKEYKPTDNDKVFVDTWMVIDALEAVVTALLIAASGLFSVAPLLVITVFIVFRAVARTVASFQYKRIHFA